jgi:hypothetical protein
MTKGYDLGCHGWGANVRAPGPLVPSMVLVLAALLAQEPLEALDYLLRHRDPEGLWERASATCRCPGSAAAPGDTGRVVLAFLALGFSHLSKDAVGGTAVGPVLDGALRFLAERQREDGAMYLADPTAHAWAALALSEAFSLTGSDRWRAPARRAAEFVQGMPAADEPTLLVQAAVRVSASSEHLVPKGPEPALDMPLARALTAAWWGRKGVAAPPVDPGTATADDIRSADLLYWNADHRRRDHQAWMKAIGEGQLRGGCAAGSWRGSLRWTAAIAGALSAGRCWPCRSVFGEK